MKKSILAVILVLSMLFTFAACGEEPKSEAYELLNAAMQKTQALDSLDSKMVMNMSMEVDGVSMEIPIEYDIKAVDMQSVFPKMAATMSVKMFGMTVETDMYMEDGYCYMSAMGQKMKVKAEDLDDYDALGQANDIMVDLDEKYLKDVAVVSGSDGKKTVTLTMNVNEFMDEFEDLIDSVGESAASGSSLEDIDISNISIEVTVDKNGYIDTYKVAYDMTVTVDVMDTTSTATASVEASIQYRNPGQSVTVTPPADYKSYPEVDPDTMN